MVPMLVNNQEPKKPYSTFSKSARSLGKSMSEADIAGVSCFLKRGFAVVMGKFPS